MVKGNQELATAGLEVVWMASERRLAGGGGCGDVGGVEAKKCEIRGGGPKVSGGASRAKRGQKGWEECNKRAPGGTPRWKDNRKRGGKQKAGGGTRRSQAHDTGADRGGSVRGHGDVHAGAGPKDETDLSRENVGKDSKQKKKGRGHRSLGDWALGATQLTARSYSKVKHRT